MAVAGGWGQQGAGAQWFWPEEVEAGYIGRRCLQEILLSRQRESEKAK